MTKEERATFYIESMQPYGVVFRKLTVCFTGRWKHDGSVFALEKASSTDFAGKVFAYMCVYNAAKKLLRDASGHGAGI